MNGAAIDRLGHMELSLRPPSLLGCDSRGPYKNSDLRGAYADVPLDAPRFTAPVGVRRVLIIENEVTFITVPKIKDNRTSLVLVIGTKGLSRGSGDL